MMLSLHTIKPAKGAKPKVKRVGRGNSSGKGTTAGRGTKGQGARSGGRNRRKLRGLRQVLLATPKLRGFKSSAKKATIVSLAQLDATFESGATVTPKTLSKKGLLTTTGGVKVLANGKLTKKLVITGCAVSAAAKAKIESAGGEVR